MLAFANKDNKLGCTFSPQINDPTSLRMHYSSSRDTDGMHLKLPKVMPRYPSQPRSNKKLSDFAQTFTNSARAYLSKPKSIKE